MVNSVDVQTVVVGAGVVGLATARALALAGREVCVLEALPEIGHGISSRNSEVVHAGIYYPTHSLKARLCVEGRKQLYRYCQERHINAKAVGKLIVATDESEIQSLNQLQLQAQANGVEDVELIDRNTAVTAQPQLECTAALHSPSTGIVDSHSLMVSLQGDIENAGGMVVCHSPVDKITVESSALSVHVGEPSAMTLRCHELINCTGLTSIPLAQQCEGLAQNSVPDALFAKGNYFKLQAPAPFDMLIYPAPVKGGLGVHLTIDLAGQARFGPDVEWLENDGTYNYEVDPARSDSFYAAIRKYWPALSDHSLLPDYAGIRPKVQGTTDFVISTQADHGVRGLVNLFGIESPGLTSSLAIGDYVVQQLAAN